jgi:hypothetical protein
MKRVVLTCGVAVLVAALATPAALAKPRPQADPADHAAALQYLAAAVEFNKQTYAHAREAVKEMDAQYAVCAAEFALVSAPHQLDIGLARAIAQGVRALQLSIPDYTAFGQTLDGISVKSRALAAYAHGVVGLTGETAKLEHGTLNLCGMLRAWRDGGYKAGGEITWVSTFVQDAGVDLRAMFGAGGILVESGRALRAAGLTRHEVGFLINVSSYGASLGLGTGFSFAFSG